MKDFSSEAPAAAMDDFERRRELRRQKREEMRQEAERATYQRNDDDEEEAARERRRRARQERQRLNKDDGEGHDGTQNSITGEETKSYSITSTDISGDDEAALQERLARREERRQKRLKEALERQKELDPTISITLNETTSFMKSSRNGEDQVQENDTSPKENNTETYRGRHEAEETETIEKSFEKNDTKEEEEVEEEHVETEEVEVKQDVPDEAPEEPHIVENEVEVTFQIKNVEMSQDGPDGEVRIEAVITREEEEVRKSTEESEAQEAAERERVEAEKRAAEERERLEEEARREAAERERIEAERKEAEERERLEEEARRKAERERAEAEERERLEAEERERQRKQEEEESRAAEEKLKAEQRKAEEEKKRQEAEEKRKAEEKKKAEEKAAAEEREKKKAAEEKARLEAKKKEEKLKAEEKKDVKADDKQVKGKKLDDKMQPAFLRKQIKDIKTKGGKEELKASWDRKSKAQNGESLHEVTPQKLKHMDKFGGAKGQPSSEETGPGTKVEAGKKLEELKRRRGESETGDFEKLKQKQQEATVELEELKKKREERRKIMEEEEQRRKQEEAERKAKEEEEKKKLKEEIERRRAEAAEKRQKLPAEDGLSEEKKPFKCFTPKALNLKIEERTEFLNRSAQKSVKASQPAVVSKIDSRLEQYTSAIGSNRPAKAAPADLPLVTEGVRNIKSKWEKGNVFSSPGSVVSPNKETAGLKVGVSSRINEWLTKTPETNKSPSSKPVDLRPGDVSGKRNIWEKQQTEKPGSPTKMTTGGKKSDTNAGLRFEKEP
ncbi:caldesmon isoform X4 [Hyla sarda]|uniref:caldesmon isoform X4 n=1 Tax=Hyla sarda TaxID=327740 RepID=UPI0024C37548|nr:caldesmon isoform X4 [Hyla sarda]